MPKFSEKSKERLNTCDVKLQQVMNEVIKEFDITVLCGYRGQKEQDEAYARGASKLKFPFGKHNFIPSKAIDISPYPQDNKDTKRFYYMAGYVMGIASRMGIELRWGGDWDRDTDFKDNNFNDLFHFEIVE